MFQFVCCVEKTFLNGKSIKIRSSVNDFHYELFGLDVISKFLEKNRKKVKNETCVKVIFCIMTSTNRKIESRIICYYIFWFKHRTLKLK